MFQPLIEADKERFDWARIRTLTYMICISSIHIYPIKSLGGISLTESDLTDTGLTWDRRWMLVDENNRFLSQRTLPELALMDVAIHDHDLVVKHKKDPENSFRFNPNQHATIKINVTIWEDECAAFMVSNEANDWFSKQLHRPVRLVYMPDSTKRKVDPEYAATSSDITSFSDAYPILMISEASLDNLNSKLLKPVGFDRFRPNLIIKGMQPHEEDLIKEFKIRDLPFYGVKPCARCIMTTIDQQTGTIGKEPLKTLSTYREKKNKVYFGQNIIGPITGKIQIGDTLTILKRSYS